MKKKIRLYTYQSKNKVDELLSTGVLKMTDKDMPNTFYNVFKDVNAEFLYYFLSETMKEKISKDSDIKSPIWAWYKYNGRYKPTRKHDSNNKNFYRIDFEIDSSKVLLTDFNMYSYFLVGCICYKTKEEHDEYLSQYMVSKNELFNSYKQMLNIDIKKDTEYTFSNRHSTIQATLWKITKDMVVKITEIK